MIEEPPDFASADDVRHSDGPRRTRWRLGTRDPFTVYRVADGAHDVEHGGYFLGSFRREEDARLAVDAVNAQAERIDLDYPAGRWRDVYVRVHGDKEVATTEQVTDTIRIDWSAPNAAGEVDIVGVEVVAATGVEVDGDPAGSAVGQRGAPTRDALVAQFDDALFYNGPDGASVFRWLDGRFTPADEPMLAGLAERMADVALAALRDGGADTGGEGEFLRPGDEVMVWGAERNRGYAVGTVESGGTFPRGIAKPVVHLRHTNFEQRDEPDEDVEPRCGAFHPEYGFTCPYLPEGHGRWHWDPAGGYWDAAGQYIDGAEDVVEQPGGGPDTGGEDDDDEVRMPPPERETIYATSADPHGSVDFDRSTGVLVATCRCGESATMWGGGSADAQRWWDKHRSGHDLLFREGDDEDDEQPHSWTELADEFKGTAQDAEEQSRKHEQETGRADLYALGCATGRSEAEARIRLMAGRLGSAADTRDTITRLARALGVSLDPDDPDPVGRLVEAAGKAREVEVVTGAEAADLADDSIYVVCHEDGRPMRGHTVVTAGWEPTVELSALTDYRVLYRAPAPAPAALAVGEVVESAADLDRRASVGTIVEDASGDIDKHGPGGWRYTELAYPVTVVRVGTGGGETGE